jgi:hypothetical protein
VTAIVTQSAGFLIGPHPGAPANLDANVSQQSVSLPELPVPTRVSNGAIVPDFAMRMGDAKLVGQAAGPAA